MDFSHSIELSGKSLKPAAGKDLKIKEPISRRYLPTLHFDGTLPAIDRPPLIRNQIRQDCKTVEEQKLASLFVMKALHHKQLSVYRIVKLIHQRGRLWNIGIRKQHVPSRLLPLYPFSHPLSILHSRQMRHLFRKSS